VTASHDFERLRVTRSLKINFIDCIQSIKFYHCDEMKKKIFVALLLSLQLAWADQRNWTSADGSKSFKGEVVSFDPASGKVTVKTSKRQMTFKQDKLSDEDQAYLKNWYAKSQKGDPADALAKQKVGQLVSNNVLTKLEGKRMKKTNLEKAPEYYLLYFSASW